MRWLRWSILLLSILLILAGGLLALAYWTPLAVRMAASIAESQLDDQLSIATVSGSPARGIELTHVRYQQAGIELELRQLDLKVSWGELFGRQLLVDRLGLQGLRVIVNSDPQAPAEPSEFDWREPIDPIALPELPVSVMLSQLLVTDFEVIMNGQSYRGERLELRAKWADDNRLTIDHLDLITSNYGELSLSAGYENEQLSIERLRWLAADEQQTVSLRGQIAPFGDDADASLAINWQDIEIPIPNQTPLWLPRGQAEIDGWLNDYQLELDTQARNRDHHGQLELQLSGDTERVELSSLRVVDGNRQLIDTAASRGQISWHDGLEWQLRLDARALNIGVLLNDWPSDIDLDIESSGRMVQTQADGQTQWQPQDQRLTIHRLRGQLRDYPLTGEGQLSSNGNDNLSGDLRIASGQDRLRISGKLAEDSQLELELELPKLSRWQSLAEGALSMQLDIGGQPMKPDLQGSLQLDDLVLAEHAISASQLNLAFDIKQLESGTGQLDVSQLRLNEEKVDQLQLSLSGDVDDHHVDLNLSHSNGSVALAVQGNTMLNEQAPQDSSWNGTLQRLDIQLEAITEAADGLWQLTEPTDLALSAANQQIAPLCLQRGERRACLQGQRDDSGAVEARIGIAGVDLEMFEKVIATPDRPSPVSLQGQLEAAAKFAWDGQTSSLPVINLGVSTDNAALRLIERPDLGWLSIDPLGLEVHSENEQARLSIDAQLDPRGSLQANLNIDALTFDAWQDATLEGQFDLAIDDLSWLEALTPDLVNAQGRLASQWRFGGQLGDPDIAGELNLENFSGEIPAQALTLSEGNVRLTSDLRAQQATVVGGIRSGDGDINLTGELGLAPEEGLPLRLEINGKRFTGMDTEMLALVISPALTIEGRLTERLNINGDLGIDSLLINLERLEAVTSPSSDVVMLDGAAGDEQQQDPPLTIAGQIRVILGDGEQVRLSGFGLQAGLGGNLIIDLVPYSDPIGRGQIRVDGSYESYGQDLQVSDGRLIYNGVTLDNPSLDIRARREVQNITAGVHLTGTARNPQANLYSDPSNLSDADRLSYIVSGRPISAIGEGGGNTDQQFASAALAYGLNSASLPRRLGVDTLEITDSPDLGGSSLLVGKQLSPRLMLNYVTSLFTSESMVQLRYQLSERWRLRVESATSESRGAIEYFDER